MKRFVKGTKVKHKTKGMIETIVGECKVKINGVWVEGVIYEGNDIHTGEPTTFIRTFEDFEKDFEICQQQQKKTIAINHKNSLKEYIRKDFFRSNIEKYYRYFDEWYNNLTDIQLEFWEKRMEGQIC